MSVTEGSDYGDTDLKPEYPDSDTAEFVMLPSGSQSGANSDAVKREVLPSGLESGADQSHIGTQPLESWEWISDIPVLFEWLVIV